MTTKRKLSRPKATKTKLGPKASEQRELSIGTDERYTAGDRAEALLHAPLAVCESDQNLDAMLKVLQDRNEPQEVRLAALQSLQAASFSVVAFESCRSDYMKALRALVDDPDMELRQRVLGLLARDKDGYAQKRLLEGLRKPDKALLPPEKALQLLGYDVHTDAYAVAREIVSAPPNVAARREALRLLAADGSSAQLFEKILRDKNELREVRQVAASALQRLRPDLMQKNAREMVLDAAEYDDIQATSLTALTEFGDIGAMVADTTLRKGVGRLQRKSSAKVKRGVKRFRDRYGG